MSAFRTTVLEHGTSPPTRGDVRLIFDERADAERAADWLEEISAGPVSPWVRRIGGGKAAGSCAATSSFPMSRRTRWRGERRCLAAQEHRRR